MQGLIRLLVAELCHTKPAQFASSNGYDRVGQHGNCGRSEQVVGEQAVSHASSQRSTNRTPLIPDEGQRDD